MSMLCHRGMIQMNLYPHCNQEVDTTFHCLRDCDFATRLWKAIGFTPFLLGCVRTTMLIFWISPSSSRIISLMRMINWNDKGGNGMILNVGGSSLGNPDVSSFRGMLRNEDGAWIHGFARNISFFNIPHAELLTIYHGLRMPWEFGILELWCYSNSKTAIKLIYEPVNDWHHYATIIFNVKELFSRD